MTSYSSFAAFRSVVIMAAVETQSATVFHFLRIPIAISPIHISRLIMISRYPSGHLSSPLFSGPDPLPFPNHPNNNCRNVETADKTR